jgi:GDP-L-fucose synthase
VEINKINKNTKIYIAGHRGMVGSAIWEALEAKGFNNLIGKTSIDLDLRNQQAVLDFFKKENPVVVVHAAAKVGGILANSDYPYQFLMENMQIQNNLIDSSLKSNLKKFLFLVCCFIYRNLVV